MATPSQSCPRPITPSPFARIVVGFVATEQGADARALAVQLAALCDAQLLLVSVIEPRRHDRSGEHPGPAVVQHDEHEHTAAALQHAAEQISRALGGARVEQRLEVSSSPARGLHDTANCEHADLIVLGSSHHGPLGRVFPGSVAERLLNGAPCAVAVAPRGHATRHPQPLGRILVAFDGSPEARLALQAAHALATRSGAALQVAMVIVPSSPGVAVGEAITFAGPGMIMPPADSEKPETLKLAAALERDENAARATLETAIAELPDGARIEHQLLVGPAAATMILERARNDTDFLVLGSRAYGPWRSALLGSVSHQIVRRAPCPVLVTPRAGQHTDPAMST